MIKCLGAKDVWCVSTLGDISAHVNSFEEWWLQVLHNINTNVATMTTMTVWNLWNNRNKLVWNNKRSSASGIISSAANILSQWQHARLFSVSQRRISISNTLPWWTKPESSWYKYNVDAVVFSHVNSIGISCIVRDEFGQMVVAKNTKLRGDANPATAEAISYREALSWLKSLRFNKVVIESDAQVVVLAILGSKEDLSYFGSVIEDCKSYTKDLGVCVFVFVKRLTNQVAYALAKSC